jgi:hypothetical protein
LVKIERSGNIGWSKTFYSRSSDYFLSIQQTHDGGYVLGSYIFKPKEKKQRENYINIRKVDPEGNMLFSHNFPCSDGFVIPQYDHKVVMFRALKIMLTKDGGYIITCPICEFQRTPLLDKKLLKIIKVSPEGSEQWTVELMGADLEESSSPSVRPTLFDSILLPLEDILVLVPVCSFIFKDPETSFSYIAYGHKCIMVNERGKIIGPENRLSDEYNRIWPEQLFCEPGYSTQFLSIKKTHDGKHVLLVKKKKVTITNKDSLNHNYTYKLQMFKFRW